MIIEVNQLAKRAGALLLQDLREALASAMLLSSTGIKLKFFAPSEAMEAICAQWIGTPIEIGKYKCRNLR